MTEKTFHTVSWAPSAIKDAVEHATEAFKAADGPYARVSTFELSALIDATRALIEHNERDEVDGELAELRDHMSLPADADAATIVRHAKIAFDLSEAGQETSVSELPLSELRERIERAIQDRAPVWGQKFDAGPGLVCSVSDAATVATRVVATEVSQLRADKEIRQGALNDVLGRDRSQNSPTDYYGAIEDVAELKRALVLAEERIAKTRQALRLDDKWSVQHGALAVRSERDRLKEALEKQQALLAAVAGACSCTPTMVAVHEPGSECSGPQYEALHELLDAELTSANMAGGDGRAYGAASRAGDLVLELLDVLRGKKSRLEVPVTEVRLDGLVPDENLERLRAILRGDEPESEGGPA